MRGSTSTRPCRPLCRLCPFPGGDRQRQRLVASCAPSTRDRDRLAGLAGDERQRAGCRRVVRARRGRPLRGRTVHRHLARRRYVPESPRRQARPRSYPPRRPRPTLTARPRRSNAASETSDAPSALYARTYSHVPPAAIPVRPPPVRRLYAIQVEAVPCNSTTRQRQNVVRWSPIQSEYRLHTKLCTTRYLCECKSSRSTGLHVMPTASRTELHAWGHRARLTSAR